MQELVHGEVRVPEIELDLLEKCHVGGRGQLGVQPGGVPGGRTVARTWRQTQDRRDAAPQDVERCVERKMGKGGGEERGDRFIYVYLRLSWEAGAVYLFMAWGPGRRSTNRSWDMIWSGVFRLLPVYFRLSWTPVYQVYPRHFDRSPGGS